MTAHPVDLNRAVDLTVDDPPRPMGSICRVMTNEAQARCRFCAKCESARALALVAQQNCKPIEAPI
jgi:hypothetical protein